VLIAMNPFASLPIYGDAWVEAYHHAGVDERATRQLGPHCYRTVEEAYCRLGYSRQQSIVICGESGAGKTVTNRKMLEYLCQVARRRTPPTTDGSHSRQISGGNGVEPSQITEANVLLESFGNAKTTRNDNSSRFGKYTKLSFDGAADGTRDCPLAICGCHVDHFLLERSRVCCQPRGERNYHVFYQLLESGEGAKYRLDGGPEAYRYTRDSVAVEGGGDASATFRDVCGAMEKAGFDDAAVTSVFEAVAAVLLLGNVEFGGSQDECRVSEASRGALVAACGLLGVEADAMSRALCSSFLRVPGGATVRRAVGVDQAEAQRDTVAKTVYSRLFDDLVAFLGSKLRRRRRRSENERSPGRRQEEELQTIGLLDIFGFEDMASNGFEQMFINLTNERIQHLFNSIMFKREVEAYRKEGIASVFDPGVDNLDCVRLFTSTSSPPGIVKLLSESALMRSGRDNAAFVSVLNSSFAQHPHFGVCGPQDAQRAARAKGLPAGGRGAIALDYRECFQIRHYAGTVMYTVQGWVPRSIDALLPHLSEVLRGSTKPSVRDLFQREESVGQKTVGESFCSQLEVLGDTLDQGEALFVRCIKSNQRMLPGVIDRPFVLEQLVNGGVIAALEMRHRGLPERLDYETFCDEFDMLEKPANAKKDFRTRCELVMRDLFGAEAERRTLFAFGQTKVFMKGRLHALLRAVLSLRTRNLVKKVQKRWRRYMGTQAIKNVTAAWERFTEAADLASGRGIGALPGVRAALQDASAKILPVVRMLQELRAAHGSDVCKIGASLPVESMGSLGHCAEAAETIVAKVLRRMDEADALLGARVGKAMAQVVRLRERVGALEAECAEVAGEVEEAERESFLRSCGAARERLERLQSREIPELKEEGPAGVDLECEAPLASADVCPALGELLACGEELVAEAERRGHEILRVRRAFQRAVQEGQGRHEAALSKLEALQQPARRCAAEGLDGIVERIGDAWRWEATTRELLREARDAEAYAEAVEAFAAAVREAEEMVERGREELFRREAENEERASLRRWLDEIQVRLAGQQETLRQNLQVRLHGQHGQRCAAETGRVAEELVQELAGLRGSAGLPLAEWRPRVEGFAQRAEATIAEAEGAVTEFQKARQDEFHKRLSAFQGAGQPRAEDAGPEDFIRSRGLSLHEGDLLEMAALMRRLKESGIQRSAAKQCLDHLFRSTWGAPTGAATPR